MANVNLEQALNKMKAGGVEEFLKSSLTVLKIMQNIMIHPEVEKFKKIRLAASVLSKPGMVELLKVVGFQEQGNYLVFPANGSVEQLKSWKKQIIEVRKATGCIEGWDVPGTSLKFSDMLGSGKFGDVFKGYLDSQSVAIKTLKPDCGDLAKAEFDRETRIMSKLHHSNVLEMLALVLTSDPVSLVLELMKENMLVVLHNEKELGEDEILRYISQVTEGMEYVHQQSILHCDLAARNILLDYNGSVKISDFGLSRTAGTEECNLVGKERQLQFPIRWTAPEVFSKLYVDKKTDVWSFGILFYEFVTAGSVPYAALSNAEVRKQVQEGHRLTQPEECPDTLFQLMQQCWMNDPEKRPSFSDIMRELHKIRYKNSNPADNRLSVSDAKERDRASTVASPKKQKKLIKIKEPSYHQAVDKGGGLIRVYTALVPPFRHRTVIACLPKTTVKEAIQMVLVQLGRDYVDPKDYHIAMLCDIIDQPPRFLSSNEHIYSLKSCKRQFVLCTHQAVGNESMILEALVASAQTNPAMIKALDPCTRGYLVSQLEVSQRVQQEVDWSRSWVAIDGSTMFTYRDEEDEGEKECQHYVDLRGCNCELANIKGKPKGTIIRIQKPDGPSYLLQASDKPEVLRWIDAIQVASTQEPSPRLADVVEGAVVQEGYLEYQEYLLNMVQQADLSKFRMTIQRNLQSSLQQPSSMTSNMKVDHGRQWSQLKSNGKLQVFYTGKPETLFELTNATLVKLNHPPALTRSADYSIEVTTAISRVVLKADLPSEHHEWSEAIQHILREQKREDIVQIGGDTGAPSGYVRLKRLMSKKKLQQQYSSSKISTGDAAPSIAEESHAMTTSQDEVAEGLYEDAKFIEHIKSLMPDLKPPEPYEPPAAPPLPPRISPSTSQHISNGVVANGGLAMKPSHHQVMPSFPPVDRRTTRSTSAYNLPYLDWGTRPTTYTDLESAELPGQFQRMDQQYLSFNAQRRRMVSPAAPLHYIDHHYRPSSSGMPPRLDYHAAFNAPQDAHMMQQQNHVSQHQHHMGQRQYDMNQQQHLPPQQNQKWSYPSKQHNHVSHQQQQQQQQHNQSQNYVNQWQYHASQQDHVSQQQRHVSQQQNHVSQQQYNLAQDHVTQQQNHVSQQQYNLAQQDHVTQQQNHVSQQKYNQPQYHDQQHLTSQQQYHLAQPDHVSQQNYNQHYYNVNQLQQHPIHQDHVSQQDDMSQHKYGQQQAQHHVTQQQYNFTQQDRVRQRQLQQNNVSQQKYNRQQYNNSQQQNYVNQQQYHLVQQDHVSQQKYNQHQYHVNQPQQHPICQDHVSQQDHMKYNQQQNQHHLSQQQYNLTQQQDHVSQQDHMKYNQQQNQHHVSQQQDHVSQQHQQQKNANKKRHRVSQQDHVSQLQENHTNQQQNHGNPQQYYTSQQNHVNKHQYHMTQQQDHVTPQQDHVTQLNQPQNPMVHHQTSLPDHQHYVNSKDHPANLPPPPDGYIKMQSVGAQVNQTSVTPPEYVVMNNHVNEAPRSYSLNIPNSPPGTESPQKPLEVLHKQEPPRVAPKPSRPPKKSALLSKGGNHTSMDTGDVSPSNSVSPPRSEATTPTAAPPVPVKKKNSLHRRKGLAIYDQPPAHSEISRISQQFESTSLSSPQSAQVPITSHNDSSYTRTHTENISPPVAPVTMAPDHDTPKNLPPGWFAKMDSGRGQFYYFNRDMGYTTWNYDEVINIHHDNETKSPGAGWKAVKTPDGRIYFYHATTRQTTWTIADTWT